MPNRRGLIDPGCCDAMKRTQAVHLLISETFWHGDLDTPPKWIVSGFISLTELRKALHSKTNYHPIDPAKLDGDPPSVTDYLEEASILASYCPFCGEAVPEIVKIDPPPGKVMRVKDGGDYCAECERRCRECNCLPPEHRWGPTGVLIS